MRVLLDIRKVRLRGAERLIVEIIDDINGTKNSLHPQPIELAFEIMEITLLDMLAEEEKRSSAMVPALKVSQDTTALIPKDKA